MLASRLPCLALLGVAPLVACAVDADPPEVDDLASHALAVTACADGPTVPGIDVSTYQGNIDWEKIAGAGVKYAFMRATLGGGYVNPTYASNWAEAKQAGILRSPYHFFLADVDPLVQAEHFIATVGSLEPGDLPPLLDVEDASGIPKASTYIARLHVWLDRVEEALGVKPIIYSGKYYWQDHLASTGDFLDYAYFLPAYVSGCPNTPTPYTRWDFWQYTSSGVLPGITVNTVDLDHFNGTEEELLAMTVAGGTCGDGLCGGGERESCVEDCPPCQLIAATGESVIDDSSECFRAGGDPQFIRSVETGWEGGSKWTYTTSSGTMTSSGRWELHFAEAGRYRLEVFTPAPTAQSVTSKYEITHAGGPTTVPVNQTASDGWQAIGDFDFAAGGDQSILVGDNTGEPIEAMVQLAFDAIRLTRLGGEVDGDDPDGPDDPGDPDDVVAVGGCGAAGASGGLGGLLIGLALAVVRRRR